MKIINNTSLSYRQIGYIIDKIVAKSEGDTHYFGQVQFTVIEFNSLKINVQIRYLKRYVEWRFDYFGSK